MAIFDNAYNEVYELIQHSDKLMYEEKKKKNGSDYKIGGLFGNKLLKRFNIIIDNLEGSIYMKPNFLYVND